MIMPMKTWRPMPDKDCLPAALYRAEQVREMDRCAIEEYGIPGDVLMERAGKAAFGLLRECWPDARRILVLAGTGNNGGDGFVLARLALQAGLEVRVLQLGDRGRINGDARTNAMRFAALSGDWLPCPDKLPEDVDLVVDAVLGTGLERSVEGRWARILGQVNAARTPVLSLDIPSGLQSDTGVVLGTAVCADVTISFIALKQGMFTADGPDCCGDIRFHALEVPARVYASHILSARRLDWAGQGTKLHPRKRSAHKGDFGHVLVVGGDKGYAGAARLCAEAALRTGAGLASLATRGEHLSAVLAGRPEIMVHGVEEVADLEPLLEKASVIALGPGLARQPWGQALWERVLETKLPLVMDADALNLLAEAPRHRKDWVLTPHPGEAARLLGRNTRDIHADRFDAVREIRQRYGGVVVLKGAGSLIAGGTHQPPAICSDGNPGMASGGMGDVLSGVIAAWMAQGWQNREAAQLGVCLHAAAGDMAARAGERGLLASDLMSHLRRLANPGNG
jgi:NAD(P)H-hydrate epimerase